jgi:hypothetical protein
MCELGLKLNYTQDETSRAGLRRRLFMLATTCFSTFDACPEHIHAILATEEDFSIAMQCAVIVHDHTPPSLLDDNSVYLARMFSRHRRLLHFWSQFWANRCRELSVTPSCCGRALTTMRLQSCG